MEASSREAYPLIGIGNEWALVAPPSSAMSIDVSQRCHDPWTILDALR